MKFKSNIEIQAGLEDKDGQVGSSGQILASTGSQVDWIDPASIVTSATDVVIECKNTSGVTISKGTPVYQTGNVGATAVIEIAVADASDEDKMAAIGLLQSDLVNNAFGYVVVTGELLNITTSPIDGSTPTVGDTIYVKPGGGLTLTKPTGVNFIQNVGLVGKVSGGNAGSITVSSIMRTNDVPNLPEGRIWVGDGNTIVSDTVYVDEPNNRVGIGTTSPNTALEVDGTISTTTSDYVQGSTGSRLLLETSGSGNTHSYIQAQNVGGTSNNEDLALQLYGGNVGIGTNSPGVKLDVVGDVYLRQTTFTNIVRPYSTQQLTLLGGGANTLFVNGNVGIGTTGPSEKLEVDGNVQIGSTTDAKLYMVSTGGNGNNERFFIEGYADGGTYGGGFKLSTRNDVNVFNTAVTVNRNGNVGIKGTGTKLGWERASDNSPNIVYLTKNEDLGVNGNAKLHGYDGIVFSTAGSESERMRIDSSGNVGIGTDSPTNYKLEVDGTVEGSAFSVDGASSRIFAPAGATYNGNGTQTGYLIAKLPDNGASGVNNMMTGVIRVFDYTFHESFDIHFAGYWYSGYNWTNCTAWIDSASYDDRNFTVRFGAMTGAAGAGTRPYITIGEGSSTWTYCKFSVINYEPGHSNYQAYKWDSGWSMDISVTNPGVVASTISNCQVNNWARNGQDLYYGSGSGNVGIGTTSPLGPLEVYRSNSGGLGGYIVINNDGTTVGNETALMFGDGGSTSIRAAISSTTENSPYFGDLKFKTGGSAYSSLNTRMIVKGTGNVGIGTTSPQAKLHVSGGSSIETTLIVGAEGTGNDKSARVFLNEGEGGVTNSKDYGFSVAYDGQGAQYGGLSANQFGILRHNNSAAGAAVMVMNRANNNTVFSGTVTGTNFILSSDEKLKENIEKACDNRIKADWKTFELKTEKGQKRYGVIAQELEKTNPEFVREDTQGFKSVAYIDLLIAKIAELEARLEKAGI